MTMTPFSLSGFLIALFSFPFGLLVLLKSPNKKLGRVWFLFSLSTTIWGIGVWRIGAAHTPEEALSAWRFVFAFGVIWMPPLFHHFVSNFCELRQKKTLLFQYALSVFLFPLCYFTSHFFNGARVVVQNLFFPTHTVLFIPFVAWWLFSLGFSHYILWKNLGGVTVQKQNQIKYFFLATSLGYTGGSTIYMTHFGIPFPIWGNFFVVLYPFIMTYAILKFNLMDVRLFIRRTALLIGLYATLLALSAPLFVVGLRAGTTHFNAVQLLSLLGIGLVFSAGPFLYVYVIKRSLYFHEHTRAGLAHELKSPLAAIQSALEMLQYNHDLATEPEKATTAYLDMIRRNSNRLSIYINELLHTYDPNRTDKQFNQTPVNLIALAQKAIETVTPAANEKNVTLALSGHSDELIINGDAEKIEQIFSNLIGNALKFTDAGSVNLHMEKKAQTVLVSVTDTGLGIPSLELPYVFDRFYQGVSGRTKKGTGLGLTLSKIWVEAHGGKIWAESEGEGKGTKVTFTLPV